ncbi:tRNA-dihydrouridine synthase [Thalassotalea profundi]|uniref:tRNA-dihydrouridine(16) synthase n=1 Tax=Thalassotalea profundi TaxID=2036687 RepID=A0ABQ3IHQ6_9GAMM|nr:tRNA-dihydrouridine synthase [Thalassotalea profundi]GHE84954.1 tRNA-dihydrouridine(16) synthase [Thalassotalea profundi]
MPKVNKLVLAPMEGVADAIMREMLTSINCYDFCITEFIRVVEKVVPTHIYHKICPELKNNGFTRNNTPIRVQLLGQHPQWMAENAIKAISLGSHGIDINFGCPAKAVNKSKGGAILLKTPDEIYQIVLAVKQAVPLGTKVSAKIRLGFDDNSLLDEIVSAVVSASADQLTIHARTKSDGYRPPAYWHLIGEISKKYPIELFANGEIWTKENAEQCIQESGTHNLMLGRGALAMPNLANVIKLNHQPMTWPDLCELIKHFAVLELSGDKSYYFSSRVKQWLRYLKLRFIEAEQLFNQIKLLKNKDEIIRAIENIHHA